MLCETGRPAPPVAEYWALEWRVHRAEHNGLYRASEYRVCSDKLSEGERAFSGSFMLWVMVMKKDETFLPLEHMPYHNIGIPLIPNRISLPTVVVNDKMVM